MPDTLFARVDAYINDLLAPEDDALTGTIAAIEREGIIQMSVSPSQGKFLQVMARLCNARRILELGTLGGYSTIWMARALPEDGVLISLESEPHHARVARENIGRAGLSGIVDIRLGKALDILPEMIAAGEAPFDLIFIDADKPPYAEYFDLALQLSRPGTLLLFDNVIREGKVLDADSADEKVQGVRRFNALLGTHPGVTATILQQVGEKDHDGIAIAVVN